MAKTRRGAKKKGTSSAGKTTRTATKKKAPAKKATAKKKAPAKKATAKKKAPAKKATAKKKAPAKKKATASELDYAPHPDAGLSARQVRVLYEKLVEVQERKTAELERHMQEALGEAGVMPDETDMAQRHTEQAYLIRFADKERKLLNEIERALEKLRIGDYGVCEGTEEPIGFKRLELRPWTRYGVAYKEQIERERSQHRR